MKSVDHFNCLNLCNLWILSILLICGCSRSPVPQSSDSPILATVNGRVITQADFDAEAVRRPTASADTLLSNLIERQAMVIRAEAAGIADSPEFKYDTETRLITRYIDETYKKERDAVTVTDDELQAAYEARKEAMFSRPPLARYAILYRKGRDTAELKTALAEALAVFEQDRDAATNKGRLQGFGKVAADHSEDTISRYRGGDIGWTGEGVASRVPVDVLEAGAPLDVGVPTEPFAAGDGVYVIMKTAVRDASQLSFKEASPALRRRLLTEKQSTVEARFKAALMDGIDVRREAEPVFKPGAKKPQPLPSSPLPVEAQ